MADVKPLSDRCNYYIDAGRCKDDRNCEFCVVNVNSAINKDKRKKFIDDMINK